MVKNAQELSDAEMETSRVDWRRLPVGSGRVDLRCMVGRLHKMQSGTCMKRDEHNRLKVTRDVFI